ncbi:nucleobase:cation symporter-2 family protein [Scopulibacillus cellulosilyticus]|uniref:Nucleobase:cation symporter-2 family protein n=1 Tax=Scopulibacillus cellulosilyticus TaxID=2665665 RepID=A0ABW2Q5A2_9BACL
MKSEKLSVWKLFLLGFQHVCVMYGGAVAVPLIIGPAIGLSQQQLVYLISFDLFTCGIASLLQVVGGKHIGIKLPALMGVSFTVVQPVIAIGSIYSIQGVIGAVMVSGVIVIILAQFFSKIIRFFPPVITASVVLIIGVTLMPVAINNAAGGTGAKDFGSITNLSLALFTLVFFIVLNTLAKGYLKTISVLISMIVGTIVAACLGVVDFTQVKEASWFNMVRPFYFGPPTFQLSSILTMSIVAIVIMVESTGTFFALGEIDKRNLTDHDIKKGLRAEGLGAVISGIFNNFNHSTFAQNVGLVALTGVTNRKIILNAGIILAILGLFPKIAALAVIIPPAVLGGAMVPMFGMLISTALRMMSKVDFTNPSNQLIIAVGVGLAIGTHTVANAFDHLPATIAMLVKNGVILGTFASFVLNIVLNEFKKPKNTKEQNVEEQDSPLEPSL